MSPILQDLSKAFAFIFSFWWLWAPILSAYLLKTVWSLYLAVKYYSRLKWVLLEIKVPRDLTKGPKATEQIFAGLHGVFLPLRFKDRWFKGRLTQDYFSLEIVGTGGSVRFFVRTLEGYRNLVESNIYAQYPEAEISLADDYFKDLPQILPNDKYDLWGSEFILAKEDSYPIRTHPMFEDPSGEKEEKRIDPLSSMAEVLTSLNPNEKIVFQILIRPATEDWAKKAKLAADKLFGRKKEEANKVQKIVDWIDALINPPDKKDEKKEEPSLMKLTPGEQEIVRSIERKISKLGFDTGMRFIYIGPKDGFNRAYVSALIGVLKQFSAQDMNGLRLNLGNYTGVRYPILKAWREFRRKVNMYKKARWRNLTMKSFVFNTEELATIFHLPGLAVKAPALEKIEAKKGQPPAGLPVE